MLDELISRSIDLKKLRDEGYCLELRGGYLIVHEVPYVNSSKEVARGTLVSKLVLAGNETAQPDNHVIYFTGEYPCDERGFPILKIQNASSTQTLDGIVIRHTFSAKPQPDGNYKDYYDKFVAYVNILSAHAKVLDPTVTAQTYSHVVSGDASTVFNYIDTASSRADIDIVSKKMALKKVAIIGLGGTGSYVLDLIAKTLVHEIHLFDKDFFFQHNAFRSPGAPSIEDLRARTKKVDYLASIYSKMRKGIVAHDVYLGPDNVEDLHGMDFVFVCMDRGIAKRAIIQKLVDLGTPFIDVGMGVNLVEGRLSGSVRVTTSTIHQRDHLRQCVPLSDATDEDDYASNIQIAELNALNAVLAVIRWKKMFGFYLDTEEEHHTTYTISGGKLLNAFNIE